MRFKLLLISNTMNFKKPINFSCLLSTILSVKFTFLSIFLMGQEADKSILDLFSKDTLNKNWTIGFNFKYGINSLPSGVSNIKDFQKTWTENKASCYGIGLSFNYLLKRKNSQNRFLETLEFDIKSQMGMPYFKENPSNPLISDLVGFQRYQTLGIEMKSGYETFVKESHIALLAVLGVSLPFKKTPDVFPKSEYGNESIYIFGGEVLVFIDRLPVVNSISFALQRSFYLRNKTYLEQGTYYFYLLGLNLSLL
jgi:hypothetical protein